MEKIEKAEINGEIIFLKKSFDGWRVIYPYKNEDGSWNRLNILTGGNYWKLLKTLFILFLVFGTIWSYRQDTQSCRDLQENICDYAVNISTYCMQQEIFEGIKDFNFTLKERRNETR